MKKIIAVLATLVTLFAFINAYAYEEAKVNFVVNSKPASFSFAPVIRDGRTYVDAKGLSSKLNLEYKKYNNHESVIISNSRISICLVPGNSYATVSDLTGKSDKEYTYRRLSAPCIYINGHLAVPARDMATVFSYALSYIKEENTVYFGYSPNMISANTKDTAYSKAYYFQNQAEFMLPSNGSGYCWTCSYAMLISNITSQRITPNDIAAINLTKSSNGAYCYHSEIATAYNLKFVSALPENSPHYGGRDSVSGGTYIKNEQGDDAVTIAAIKEALDHHPEGVLVRYAAFPHTMIAVAYEGDIILFNDPAPSASGTYSDTGRYQAVPFSETCVSKKGFVLSDVTFIQAMGY